MLCVNNSLWIYDSFYPYSKEVDEHGYYLDGEDKGIYLRPAKSTVGQVGCVGHLTGKQALYN